MYSTLYDLESRLVKRYISCVRAHGVRTYEPRQGRKAATVVCFVFAVVTLALSYSPECLLIAKRRCYGLFREPKFYFTLYFFFLGMFRLVESGSLAGRQQTKYPDYSG